MKVEPKEKTFLWKLLNSFLDKILIFQNFFSFIFFILFLSYVINESILLKNEEKFTFPGNFVSLQNKETSLKNNFNFTIPETDDDISDEDYTIPDEDDDYNLEKFERKNNELYVHLWCEGNLNSSFTIILESDLGSNHLEWISLMNHSFYQKEKFRICCYDRLGFGFSHSKSNSTLNEMMEHFNLMLINSGENKPFLFVGNGFGSLFLMNYVLKYQRYQIGLILLNSLKDIKSQKQQIKMNELLSYFGYYRFEEYFGYFKQMFKKQESEEKINFIDHHTTTNQQIRHNEINSNSYWKSLTNEIKIYKEMKEKLQKKSIDTKEIKIQFLDHSEIKEQSEFKKLFQNSEQKIIPNDFNEQNLFQEIKNFITKKKPSTSEKILTNKNS